ncbi:hypothetical protein ACAG26_24365 [Mycobacterium sp. pUA109]|uniref:hypothetical protein n=1 Tax=Mycobacterium sp. pUA109 TaxID=3238982 RepID=UPI00351B434A
MSDRRLLALINALPEDSAYKTARREDWGLAEQISTGVLNELKAMRGDLWALIGHERLPFKPVLTPGAQRQQRAKRDAIRAVHDDISDRLHGRKRG